MVRRAFGCQARRQMQVVHCEEEQVRVAEMVGDRGRVPDLQRDVVVAERLVLQFMALADRHAHYGEVNDSVYRVTLTRDRRQIMSDLGWDVLPLHGAGQHNLLPGSKRDEGGGAGQLVRQVRPVAGIRLLVIRRRTKPWQSRSKSWWALFSPKVFKPKRICCASCVGLSTFGL